MEINRNQYFMAGMIVLFLGIQFRLVDTYVLNDETSNFLAKRLNRTAVASTDTVPLFLSAPQTAAFSHREIRPPSWLGWAFLSVGAVLVLHSFAMSRPQ